MSLEEAIEDEERVIRGAGYLSARGDGRVAAGRQGRCRSQGSVHLEWVISRLSKTSLIILSLHRQLGAVARL